MAAGTDAPFGRPDPWALIDAAVRRRTPSGAVLGDDERLAPLDALDLLLHPGRHPFEAARRVAVGGPADLCLLAAPLADALADPVRVQVAATIIDGRVHHRSG